jgi:hypothetical protein
MGVVSLVVGLAGCLVPQPSKDRVFHAEIGPEGGELSGAGLTLTVPPGALSDTQTLSMTVTHEEVDGQEVLSPVYVFEPEGLQFDTMVQVEVEVPTEDIATLYWSDPEDPSRHVFAGLAVGGVARGYTWHFSSAFVGSGVCEAPTATADECVCRASDEQGDLLCREEPEDQSGSDCDLQYQGDDGMSCSGYGLRPVIESWCWCQTDDEEHYLCVDPFELYPNQYCPSEWGMPSHEGEPGGPCSGYYVDWDSNNQPYNVAASGTRVDCNVSTAEYVYDSVSGTLECDEVDAEPAAPTPECGGEDAGEDPGEFPSWEPDCLELLEGADLSCAGEPVLDAVLEVFLAQEDQARHLTRLLIPDIDGSEACERLLPFDPHLGKVDLVRVLPPFDGPEVVIEIAELGVLDTSSLPLGLASVYACYEERIEEAGRACETDDPGSLDDEERAFCQALEAQGRRVVLGPQTGFLWKPEPSRLFPDLPSLEVPGVGQIHLSGCTAGLTAFLCQ